MITKAAAGLGLVLSGVMADSFGILSSWSFSALVLLIGIIWFYGNNKKHNPSP
jgi:predicted MFS family arabinose efflux permease